MSCLNPSCFAPARTPSPVLAARLVRTDEDIASTLYKHQRAVDKTCERTLNHRFAAEIRPIQKALREERKASGRRLGYPLGGDWVVTEQGFKVQRPLWNRQESLTAPVLTGVRMGEETVLDRAFLVDLQADPLPPQRRPKGPNALVRAGNAVGGFFVHAALLSAVLVFATAQNVRRDWQHRHEADA